jgi:PLP dependent protein
MDSVKMLLSELPQHVQLVAVSKTHSVDEIKEVYNEGIRHFGENKVQEMIAKQPLLPADINWHLIGHLQTNKVKFIAPFVSLIQSADSLKILKEINSQAQKNNRTIDCLLQIYIAAEDTKYGLDFAEAEDILSSGITSQLANVRITGLMGMATFTDDISQVQKEFSSLKAFFDKVKDAYFKDSSFSILSMGMTSDYKTAIEQGSTMVRIGTALFGERSRK